jgi:pimeloyl-ACP methyl ester carboxylesterase
MILFCQKILYTIKGDTVKLKLVMMFSYCIYNLPILALNCMLLSDPATDVDSVIYLFAHGLAATHKQGLSLFAHLATQQTQQPCYNNHYIIKNPLVLFDFPDAKNDDRLEWHHEHVNLGQDLDIATLHDAYEYALAQYPDRDVVLAGVSRGAATIINFVAKFKPNRVKALVLESPFDTLENVIKHLLNRHHIGWIPFSYTLAAKYMQSQFPLLKLEGIVPAQVVQQIPHDIAIFLVHGENDKTVPKKSSELLYIKLREAGHNKVHLFEIATGNHARIMQGPEAWLYHQVVHAFYKNYQLPHDAQAASRGEFVFKHCQPPVEEVKSRIKKKRKNKLRLPDDELQNIQDVLDTFVIT